MSYHTNKGDYRPFSDDQITYVLADFADIFPFGYPTEQFFTWMKNDVVTKIEESKKAKKEEIAKMKRDVAGGVGAKDDKKKKDEDTGLVAFSGRILKFPFNVLTPTTTKVRCEFKIVDTLYNSLRIVQKDSKQLNFRVEMTHPSKSLRDGKAKQKSPIGSNEPSTDINKFGYNPALERRVHYKECPQVSQDNKPKWMNINYMIQHTDYETAYRCDVEKFEKANKMNIKKNDEFKRDEEFMAVETSFKKMRQIMLQKKFETIYTDNLNGDPNDQARLDKMADKEQQRRRNARNAEPLHAKGVSETCAEESTIRVMQGPFYKLNSKQGIAEDDFVTCAQKDLIDRVHTQAHRILLIGKPRSGKTTLAKNLAKRLDIVHINIENWLLKLQEKVKAYEPPEDLEEG